MLLTGKNSRNGLRHFRRLSEIHFITGAIWSFRDIWISRSVNGDTAEEVWNKCNAVLQQEDMSARGMILKSNVTHLCTTDDPADSLEWHKR